MKTKHDIDIVRMALGKLYGGGLAEAVDLSPRVSQNAVFDITLPTGDQMIAKVSKYGVYRRCLEDHRLIQAWLSQLRTTKYAEFLAHPLTLDDEIFSFFFEGRWVIFYHKLPYQQFLPSVLNSDQIRAFAKQMALFHHHCLALSPSLPMPTYSVVSDMADLVRNVESFGFLSKSEKKIVLSHGKTFLSQVARCGYHRKLRIPLLVDWNIGNFSIDEDQYDFKLFSRWDYDWFRVEPSIFDFYFLSRVVSQEGDKKNFSYLPDCLNETRFHLFLKEYHQYSPLDDDDFLLIPEVYRFFILNYVIRGGNSFFQPPLFQRLKDESFQIYLPRIKDIHCADIFSASIRDTATRI